MKISDLKDSPDFKETQFYKDYGASALFVGIDRRSGVIHSGFHEYVPSDRKPRDTFILFHELANYMSMQKLGINIRQGIFATRKSSHAQVFGDVVYRLIPNDGYEMFYNPDVEDFTVHTLQSGRTYQKQARVIESHSRVFFRYAFDHGFDKSKDYTRYLRDNVGKIDYSNFIESVFTLSKTFFEDYFEDYELDDEKLKEKFYTELKKMWVNYYEDIKFYIDGLIKIKDITGVSSGTEGIEVITFPYNGFWLV